MTNDPFKTWAEKNVAPVNERGFSEGEMKGYAISQGDVDNSHSHPVSATPNFSPFQRGDVVRLRSGGPPMTVTVVRSTTEGVIIETRWFEMAELCGASFYEEELRVEGKETP